MMKCKATALSLAMFVSMALLSSGIDTSDDQLTLELLPAPGTTNDVIHITIDENMRADPFAPGNHPIMGITPEEIRIILTPLDAKNVGDILLIEHNTKDKFRVFSGTVRGFYDASGQTYDFAKTNVGWALTRESALSPGDLSYVTSSSSNMPDPNIIPDLSKENFRISGVSIADIRDILNQLDSRRVNRILSIKCKVSGNIEVMTGTIRGFLNADGEVYVFEKISGKWSLTQEMQWISQQSGPPYAPQTARR